METELRKSQMKKFQAFFKPQKSRFITIFDTISEPQELNEIIANVKGLESLMLARLPIHLFKAKIESISPKSYLFQYLTAGIGTEITKFTPLCKIKFHMEKGRLITENYFEFYVSEQEEFQKSLFLLSEYVQEFLGYDLIQYKSVGKEIHNAYSQFQINENNGLRIIGQLFEKAN